MLKVMQRATSIMHRVVRLLTQCAFGCRDSCARAFGGDTQLDDIVDFTQIETHQFATKKEKFDIRSMLHTTVEMAKNTEWYKGNVKIVVQVDPTVPSKAFYEVKRVEQVLMNLLTNGLKYTRQGQVVVRCYVANTVSAEKVHTAQTDHVKGESDGREYRGSVTVGRYRTGGESGEEDDCGEGKTNYGKEESAILCFEIEDTGVGISIEDQQNLFSVYTHIDVPTLLCSEKTGNSPLPLSLVLWPRMARN